MAGNDRDSKVILTKRDGKILSLFFRKGRLYRASAEPEEGSILGGIYVGRVRQIKENMPAAFVEIEPGLLCFLDQKEVRDPVLMNRAYDGRLKAGDEILVQVSREAMGTKPPSVSASLSLDGRFCVVSTGRPGIFYSSRLSAKARQRLSEMVEVPEAGVLEVAGRFGIVLRTSAGELREDGRLLLEEIHRLAKTLEELIAHAGHRTCFSCLYRKMPAYLSGIRDLQKQEYRELITDDAEIMEQIRRFFTSFSERDSGVQVPVPPSGDRPENGELPSLRFYQDEQLSLAKLYSIDTRLEEAQARKVWLKSGGYLVIDPTEALTVIDVNSGKMSKKKEAEAMYLQMNLEAAEEIALQLSLRNLSGIIIVDFINMKEEEARKKLMAHLGDLLKQDPVKTALVDMTVLGLVEITRKKINRPLKEQLKKE